MRHIGASGSGAPDIRFCANHSTTADIRDIKTGELRCRCTQIAGHRGSWSAGTV